MYAIIRTGGKQAKVRPGDVLDVELLKGADEEVTFTPLLVVGADGVAVSDKATLAGIPVTAKVLGEVKGDKIDIFKYKNKTGYSRRMGHRQRYSQIEVLSIGDSKPEAKPKAAPKAEAEPVAASEEE
jgi:large subunit ribosomal protein L21